MNHQLFLLLPGRISPGATVNTLPVEMLETTGWDSWNSAPVPPELSFTHVDKGSLHTDRPDHCTSNVMAQLP